MFSVLRFSSWWSEGADSKRGNSRETHSLSLSLTLNSLTHSLSLSLSLCPTPSLTRRDVMTLAGKAAENGFAQDSLPPPQMFSYKQQTHSLTHSCKRKKRIHLLVSLRSTRTHAPTHTLFSKATCPSSDEFTNFSTSLCSHMSSEASNVHLTFLHEPHKTLAPIKRSQ